MTPEEFHDLLKPQKIDWLYQPEDAERLAAAMAGVNEIQRKRLSKIAAQLSRNALHFNDRCFACVAVLAACPLSEARKVLAINLGVFEPAAIQVLLDRRPSWTDEWVAHKLNGAWPEISWNMVRSLIKAKVCQKPLGDGYVNLLASAHWGGPAAEQRIPISQWLLAESDLLEDVWRFFEVNVLGVFSERGPWALALIELANQGHLYRQRMLDASLTALDNDAPDYVLNGYSTFFTSLEPTKEELAVRQPRFLELLSHRKSSIVTFALQQFERLQQQSALDPETFLSAARAVFRLKPKVQSKSALSLAAKIAKSRPELVPEAINLAVEALSHDSADVQERAVELLEQWLPRAHRDHAVAIGERLNGASPTVRERLQAIVSQLGGGVLPETPNDSVVEADEFLAGFVQQAAPIDPRWRAVAGIDEAIEAMRQHRLPAPLSFDLLEVPVLTGVAPITPIATVDELLDAVAHAVEEIDSADELERILDGISRLCGERPPDFERRAEPIAHRLDKAQPRGGRGLIDSVFVPAALHELLLRWLGSDLAAPSRELPESAGALVRFIDRRVKEIVQRVINRRPAPLLAAPTHLGGWIDPLAFVRRLIDLRMQHSEPATCDLIQALLRLAPERRDAALEEVRDLEGFFGRVVQWTLGGPGNLMEGAGDSAAIWLAAGRGRFPHAELDVLAPKVIGNEPDCISPARYQWRASDHKTKWVRSGSVSVIIEVSPPVTRSLSSVLRPTVSLHELSRFRFFGAWYHQWLRSVWPLNGDPLLAASVFTLTSRVNAPASMLEPNYVILEALLEADRPWSELAYLVLWIALVSKDADARGAGLDGFIAAIEDGRADPAKTADVLVRMREAAWVKLNRVAGSLREASRVSPLHAWFAAEVLQGFVVHLQNWPADMHHLLELLLELLADLNRPPSVALRERLEPSRMTGKTGKIARSLLALDFSGPSAKTTAAIQQACSARLARAQRWSGI